MRNLLAGVEAHLVKAKIPLRVSPKAAVFRIYRDIRFSSDKTPYKTHVGGILYKDGKKDAPGVLYVHLDEKESFTAAGFWQPEREYLTKWRLKMQEAPKDFAKIAHKLSQKGFPIQLSDDLKRMPRGFDGIAESELAPYFRLQSFIVQQQLSAADLASARLPSLIAKFAADAKPLLEYGWSIAVTKQQVFVD
jgi:uncharacterized protein (TIGR02453 family)